MSKSMVNTRQKILDKALEMFNERGVEYVGLRELAGVLDIRVGNITYYFPTKDDLVYELSLELSRKNATVLIVRTGLTLLTFLEMLHQVFRHHVQFRCLLLSFVHLMTQNKRIAASYKKTQHLRNAALTSNIQELATQGYLRVSDEMQLEFLVSTLALISRFWISEAAISFRQTSNEDQMHHYLSLVTNLLMPYATRKGRNDMQLFLDNCPAVP